MILENNFTITNHFAYRARPNSIHGCPTFQYLPPLRFKILHRYVCLSSTFPLPSRIFLWPNHWINWSNRGWRSCFFQFVHILLVLLTRFMLVENILGVTLNLANLTPYRLYDLCFMWDPLPSFVITSWLWLRPRCWVSICGHQLHRPIWRDRYALLRKWRIGYELSTICKCDDTYKKSKENQYSFTIFVPHEKVRKVTDEYRKGIGWKMICMWFLWSFVCSGFSLFLIIVPTLHWPLNGLPRQTGNVAHTPIALSWRKFPTTQTNFWPAQTWFIVPTCTYKHHYFINFSINRATPVLILNPYSSELMIQKLASRPSGVRCSC